ncbi:MAG TPA: hypothetical protein VF395_19490 [Polyangiaceae bacterium]
MIEPIIARAGGYEARTDGRALEIRRSNGVVVGEGRIGLFGGSFQVGDYEGKLDEHVHHAIVELLQEHETDIVVRWIASERRGPLS